MVTGTVVVAYPDFETVRFCVLFVSPVKVTCPGGVHSVVYVNDTSDTIGVFVAEMVDRYALYRMYLFPSLLLFTVESGEI
jgi:hypothetical protein